MLQNTSQLSVSINGKNHLYFCQMDCTTEEVTKALLEMIKYVGQVEANAKAQRELEQQIVVEPDSIESAKIESIKE